MRSIVHIMRSRGHRKAAGRGVASGFTLIELLVVIAIVAILAALLFPSMKKGLARGRQALCTSNLHQWVVFWQMYASDNKGSYPDGVSGPEPAQGRIGWKRGSWATELKDYYMKKTGILYCPEATKSRAVGGSLVTYGGPRNTYDHDSSLNKIAPRASYGINCWLYNIPSDLKGIQKREAVKHWRTTDNLSEQSALPVFMDSMWRGAGPDTDDSQAFEPPKYNGEWSGAGYEMKHVAMKRHNNGVLIGFADGAVRYIKVTDVWGLKWHRDYDRSKKISLPAWMYEKEE